MTNSAMAANSKASGKPYIGMNMEGMIARWYAKNTGRDRATFRAEALEAVSRVARRCSDS